MCQDGFEKLPHFDELRRINYLAHFGKIQQAGNPRKGWAGVLAWRDPGKLMPGSGPVRSEELHDASSGNGAVSELTMT